MIPLTVAVIGFTTPETIYNSAALTPALPSTILLQQIGNEALCPETGLSKKTLGPGIHVSREGFAPHRRYFGPLCFFSSFLFSTIKVYKEFSSQFRTKHLASVQRKIIKKQLHLIDYSGSKFHCQKKSSMSNNACFYQLQVK